ncbi:TspO/MBR family protein [Larsenimonas suaedae]|uniref:Tryptophan-rich sensory protein n=1 Tax=Larsenimonas suaedae TaxID=1851019 RepID=A0ABU1GV11_9GAMM|nr:TspO/MBR family protein [Larsenimonas suaedae]MCM2971765.1 tryptophan-rich sensory protein [Larsenimonas suaedae]MDR5895317.1 tryptophan-rich sensory protein [Larsenimonas suaedae]
MRDSEHPMSIPAPSSRTLSPAGGLLAWLGLSAFALLLGAVASVDARSLYEQLEQPGWAPPGWVFGPVWTTLYVLMGFAAWRVWRIGGFSARKGILTLYLVQLGVNMLWSWLFFSWTMGLAALADVVVLWMLILATLIGFWRADWLAGVLMLPYLAWVTLATALTAWVWSHNPYILG